MQAIREYDFLLVARRWARRSRYTSVERFLHFFPNAHTVTSEQAFKRPYRLLRRLCNRAGNDGYTSHSVGIEMAAFRQIFCHFPKLVHFLYADHDYYYAGRIASIFGAKVVGTFWFSIEEFERRMPNKAHLHHLDLVIATGRAQMKYLARFVPAERLAYLPLGVDTNFFRPPKTPENRWKENPRILQVGNNRRDFNTALSVFQRLKKRCPDLEMHMVGCRELAPQFAQEPDVIFYSFLNDEQLLNLYQKSTLLLLPLLEGGSSNALNEALATGLPVVATNMPNLKDYVSNDCVFSCPQYDIDSMVEASLKLLKDRKVWCVTSLAARQTAVRFDWQRVRCQLLSLYKEYLHVSVLH